MGFLHSLTFNDVHPAAEALLRHPSQQSQSQLRKFLFHPGRVDGSGHGAALPAVPGETGTAQGHGQLPVQGAHEGWQSQRGTGKSVSYTGGSSWAGAAAGAAKGTSCRTTIRIRSVRVQGLFSPPASHPSSTILHPTETLHPLKFLAWLTPAPKLLQQKSDLNE